jgi:anti-sigma factor RsiW
MSSRCETVEPLLSAWLDDELRPEERVAVAAHLDRCAACRADAEQVRWTRSLARSLPVRRAPEELLEGAARTAVAGPSRPAAGSLDRPGRGSAGVMLRRAGATAAVMVGLVAGVAYTLGGAPADTRTVRVPLDLYVADHLVHSVDGPVTTPVVFGASR